MADILGEVHLNVRNLARVTQFYRQTIGLQIRKEQSNCVELGTESRTLLVLHETPDGKPSQGGTGLYHIALLLPERKELARILRHFAENQTRLQGLSDHDVSEAIYLGDPEGNGIEIYADRPKKVWEFVDNTIKMSTLPLNVENLFTELSNDDARFSRIPEGTIMGHVHLHVSNIEQSEKFYQEILGMDLMLKYGDMASFLSYESYHHHIGVNTWRSGTASATDENTLGLAYYTLRHPDIESVQINAEQANITYTQVDSGILIRDPSGNGIKVVQTE